MKNQKNIEVAGVGNVKFVKRKSARNIRLRIDHYGQVMVSLPFWTPYKLAIQFVESKKDWINKHQSTLTKHTFSHGERIGKAHRLQFVSSKGQKISTRVTDTEIRVHVPDSVTNTSQEVQRAIEKAAIRALKKEATDLLLPKLRDLSLRHDLPYKSATVKRLSSRWGSCSAIKEITLNCYLMQLPWELIDYVLLHELLHTKILAHGPKFWSELDNFVKDLPSKRKSIKSFHPALFPQD